MSTAVVGPARRRRWFRAPLVLSAIGSVVFAVFPATGALAGAGYLSLVPPGPFGGGYGFGTQEGQSFSQNYYVGTFNEADGNTDPSLYTVTIDWGDGSALDTTTGVVTQSQDGNPADFDVSGTHTYSAPDELLTNLTAVITISDTDGDTLSWNDNVNIGDAPLSTTTGCCGPGSETPIPQPTVRLVEGQTFTGNVGTFMDQNTLAPASDFTAMIDWGDGTSPTSGTVSATSPAGFFNVSGSHQYTEASATPYAITVSVYDDGGSQLVVNPDPNQFNQGQAIANTATVSEGVLNPGTVTQVTAKVRSAWHGVLTTFTDSDLAAQTGDYSATINWGDSPKKAAADITTGVISTGAGGTFTVSGAKTYATTGNYLITIKIQEADNPTATMIIVSDTASVTRK